MNIVTKDVKVILDKKEIVKGISVNINKKEIVGIVGPNGSGKSTFLKSIYRVIKANHGSIKIGDKDIYSMSDKEYGRNIAVLVQENNINFDFSVIEIVLLGRYPHKKNYEKDNKKDYEIANESLKMVGMEEFKYRSYTSLSGGEKQRVLLARALTQQPKVLILDEPTNHLDIKYQMEIMEVIKKLGITVFSAIHDMNIACKYCDKIYALKDGQVVSQGKPDEVFNTNFFAEVFEVNADIQFHKKSNRLNIVYM